MILALSPPYNWCDSRCERCPLATTCPVSSRAGKSIVESLRESIALGEQALLDQGLDPDDCPPPPPPSIDERILRDTAFAWAMSADLLGDLEGRHFLVCAKVARIAGMEGRCRDDNDRDGLRDFDTIPNLILLEHTLEQVRHSIERFRPTAPRDAMDAFDEHDRSLRGLLAPLLGLITDRHRRVLEALAAAGRAPSPFSTVRLR